MLQSGETNLPKSGVIYAGVLRNNSTSTKALVEVGELNELRRQRLGFITGVVHNANNPELFGSFNQGAFSFSYKKSDDGYTFIIITPATVDTRVIIRFLDEMIGEFDNGCDTISYTGKLNNLLLKYQDTSSMDQISSILSTTDQTKAILQGAVTDMYDSGPKLQQFEQHASSVGEKSKQTVVVADQVKQTVFWKTWKCRIFCCCVLIVIILIILFAVCGITFKKCTGEGSETNVNVNVPTPPPASGTPTKV